MLDVLKNCDCLIDLGKEGGEILAYGTPKQMANNSESYTRWFLNKLLDK
jgi:excinuclease ABC subunit A